MILWIIVWIWAVLNLAFLASIVLRAWNRAGRPPFIAWITDTYTSDGR